MRNTKHTIIQIVACIVLVIFAVSPTLATAKSTVEYRIRQQNMMTTKDINIESLKNRIINVKNEADIKIAKNKQEEEARHASKKEMISRGNLDRGFLNFDVRKPSGLTAKQLDTVLKGTGLYGLGKHFIKAEEESGINALAVASIAANESKWGTSSLAKERNNLFGYHAYDSDVNKAQWFNSKDEAIVIVAKALKTDYLTENGEYFNGYTLRDINKRYASDKLWCIKVADIMRRLSAKIE